MNEAREEPHSGKKLRDDPERRENLLERLDRYLDLPLSLASLVLVLIAIIQLGGEVEPPWDRRMEALGWALWGLFFVEFAAKFVLAPNKRHYVTRRWLDVLVLLVPFLRFLRLLRVLRVTWSSRSSGFWYSGDEARVLPSRCFAAVAWGSSPSPP